MCLIHIVQHICERFYNYLHAVVIQQLYKNPRYLLLLNKFLSLVPLKLHFCSYLYNFKIMYKYTKNIIEKQIFKKFNLSVMRYQLRHCCSPLFYFCYYHIPRKAYKRIYHYICPNRVFAI